jgi:hypothetical protein
MEVRPAPLDDSVQRPLEVEGHTRPYSAIRGVGLREMRPSPVAPAESPLAIRRQAESQIPG